jgi:UDP-N-acetyl-3-dehydro-alpha-D-glucosamine 3-aminotranferase
VKVPMLDLVGEYRELHAEIEPAVGRVLASGHYILGQEGSRLEAEVARYVGVPHAVAVASGTDALILSLRAAGIGSGDEVVTPSFTFIAAAEAITHVGARPVFADIDPLTYNMDPACLEAVLTRATRAVVAVHLFGQSAAIAEIRAICRDRRLVLIEDCAQAIGADYDGVRVGGWGALGCFSFYPTKNLGAYGDAGLVTTHDKGLAERLRMLRHHGSHMTYQHEIVGYNSRLDELQAAILLAKCAHLDRFNAARREHAAAYREGLSGAPLGLPHEHGRGTHVYHVFCVRVARRDSVREALTANGIATGIYYPVPVHRQPAYEREFGGLQLPHSEAAAREVLALPIYPQLDRERIGLVCEALRGAL